MDGMNSQQLVDLLILLSDRLERLSVDSRWSRRASGLRGNILKVLSESKLREISSERMTLLIQRAFEILTSAAREIPDMDDLLHSHRLKR
jgi:hypothetical protein